MTGREENEDDLGAAGLSGASGSEIVPIDFHGDEVPVVDVNGRPHVVVKPAVENIGLDYWAQVRKLKEHSWATTASKAVVAADGKVRVMVTCDIRTFLMLLATVDERRVAKDVAPKLITYQAEVADAIEAYWTQGGALNPRANAEQTQALIARSTAQLSMLQAAAGLIDPKHLEAKARIVVARGLGEQPELDPASTPLYAQSFLEEKGLSRKEIQSMSSMFGKRVKAAYELEHGVTPGKYPQTTPSGQVRQVFAYTETDRPLLDEVWRRYYEGNAS